MTKKQHRAEFVTNLQLEQDAIKAFIRILKKEQNALVQGSIEELDFFASEKIQVIKKLTDFANQRNQYLVDKNLPLDAKVINKLLTSENYNAEIGAIWAELLQLVKVMQQLNQTNGTMITARLQQTQQALAALQGAAGNVSLYGPKGQTMAIGN